MSKKPEATVTQRATAAKPGRARDARTGEFVTVRTASDSSKRAIKQFSSDFSRALADLAKR